LWWKERRKKKRGRMSIKLANGLMTTASGIRIWLPSLNVIGTQLFLTS
jgi:hypothetical protein